MKAYECTRCDSFGTSGDPESQRCECDDVEDGLRAEIERLTDAKLYGEKVCAELVAERDAALARVAELETCHRDDVELTAQLEHERDVLRECWEDAQRVGNQRLVELRAVSTHVDNVWRWQGDGCDHPESLSCPVVMTADTLREFVAERDTLRAQLAEVEAERDAALGAPNGCHRGGLLIDHIERETAERIAQMADAEAAACGRSTTGRAAARTLTAFAANIRTGAWKAGDK